MYFGSVRFFKHLILTAIALMIIIPTLLSVVLFVNNCNLKKEIAVFNGNDNADVSNANGLPNLHDGNVVWANEATNTDGNGNNLSSDDTDNKTLGNVNDSVDMDNFEGEPMDYQLKYEDMYAPAYEMKDAEEDAKLVYLTFDDGPSDRTPQVLDILKRNGIKATFFVTGCNDDKGKDLLKRIVNEGHTIAVHTYTHDYKKIYSSVESYLDDFALMYDCIYETTGVKPNLFRFPGGSINVYNQAIYQQIISEMLRRNFIYHDWNVSAQDAISGGSTKEKVYEAVVNDVKKRNKSIVLMHDSHEKTYTVDALQSIIDTLKKDGYKFDKLDNTVRPNIFGYNS